MTFCFAPQSKRASAFLERGQGWPPLSGGPIRLCLAPGDGASFDVDAIAASDGSKPGEIWSILEVQPDRPTDLAFTTDGRKLRGFVPDDDPSSTTLSEASFNNLDTGA